jgi:hypothetical protein
MRVCAHRLPKDHAQIAACDVSSLEGNHQLSLQSSLVIVNCNLEHPHATYQNVGPREDGIILKGTGA